MLQAIDEKLSVMRSEIRMEALRSSSAYELITGKQYRKAVIVTAGKINVKLFYLNVLYVGHRCPTVGQKPSFLRLILAEITID